MRLSSSRLQRSGCPESGTVQCTCRVQSLGTAPRATCNSASQAVCRLQRHRPLCILRPDHSSGCSRHRLRRGLPGVPAYRRKPVLPDVPCTPERRVPYSEEPRQCTPERLHGNYHLHRQEGCCGKRRCTYRAGDSLPLHRCPRVRHRSDPEGRPGRMSDDGRYSRAPARLPLCRAGHVP